MPSKKTSNIFTSLNLDLSDYVLKNDMMRNARNMRIIDLESSTFALTNLKGTDDAVFTLTAGFKPLATATYDEVIYILSYNQATSQTEIGSYPSPAGSVYSPFQNLDGGDFRTTKFGYNQDSIVKLEASFDYDESINIIVISPDDRPRIINSKFYRDSSGNLVETEDRPGTANSNTYTDSSVEKEARLILTSDKILRIDFGGISSGGKLKPGNYQYVFAYMTEDLNMTDIAGESSICQVYPGSSLGDISASSIETRKTVTLQLSNVDTDFQYLKVWMRYAPGDDSGTELLYEFTEPYTIRGSNFSFTHTGFEQLKEVSFDEVNIDSTVIVSANTGAQLNGYLILGGTKEQEGNWTDYITAAQEISHEIKENALTYNGDNPSHGFYSPTAVYYQLGYFRAETYPFGIVFIMNDGSLSPVFPVKGGDHVEDIYSASDLVTNGLIRFPSANDSPFTSYTSGSGKIHPMYLRFGLGNISSTIRNDTLGFFFVRGERNPDRLTQGALLPTMKVPPVEYIKYEKYYYKEYSNADDFVHVPHVSRMMEAFARDATEGGDEKYVLGVDSSAVNYIKDGYMPVLVNDLNEGYPGGYPLDIFPDDYWALLSGDAIVDEARYVSYLTRDNVGIHQIAKIYGLVGSAVSPVYDLPQGNEVGIHFNHLLNTFYSSKYAYDVDCKFVPGEILSAGHEFTSKVVNRLLYTRSAASHIAFDIHQTYNSYFGIVVNSGTLQDSGKSDNGPRNKNFPVEEWNQEDSQTSGTHWENLDGVGRPYGFLVDIYPRATGPITDINLLYPTVDGISYRQVTPRYSWSDVPTNSVDVHGGDCYITKVTRKLNQSGFRNRTRVYEGDEALRNIDSGMLYSWIQESIYNTHLRLPYQFDVNEIEKRSFFPLESEGDALKFRQYRLPETTRAGIGYTLNLRTKAHFKIEDETIILRNNFFSRAVHSAKHVPNSYVNGYRSFTGINFQDYDPSMGKIVYMTNHRGRMFVVFEHGIGIAEIEQRIQTGQDVAGSIFVETKGVLPPVMGYASREIGCQNPHSIVQTPSAIYGIDSERTKIWQFRDNLIAISDLGVASWLKSNSITNPVSGYDSEYAEVIFATDDWALCFKEGMERFTSFYDYSATVFARKGKEFYSLRSNGAGAWAGYRHNSGSNYTIYGNSVKSYVEFVVNEAANLTKVYDYISLISNEVRPSKIEWFTYPEESTRYNTITPAATGQYSHVEDTLDTARQENQIRFRDKKFVSQVPNTEIYNGQQDIWKAGGRMRNLYMICRVTYEATKPVQLLSVLTDYRISAS